MEPIDLAEYRIIYSARRKEAEAEIDTIADFKSNAFPDFCYRDFSGKYNHDNGACPVRSSLDLNHGDEDLNHGVCPFEEWDMFNDQLRWIDTAKFISCYFRNPASACSQRILHGFDRHHFIHYYRYVLSASL